MSELLDVCGALGVSCCGPHSSCLNVPPCKDKLVGRWLWNCLAQLACRRRHHVPGSCTLYGVYRLRSARWHPFPLLHGAWAPQQDAVLCGHMCGQPTRRGGLRRSGGMCGMLEVMRVLSIRFGGGLGGGVVTTGRGPRAALPGEFVAEGVMRLRGSRWAKRRTGHGRRWDSGGASAVLCFKRVVSIAISCSMMAPWVCGVMAAGGTSGKLPALLSGQGGVLANCACMCLGGGGWLGGGRHCAGQVHFVAKEIVQRGRACCWSVAAGGVSPSLVFCTLSCSLGLVYSGIALLRFFNG